MTNFQKRIANNGLTVRQMAKNSVMVTQVGDDQEPQSSAVAPCKNPYYVNYKEKYRDYICSFITMKIDNQEMELEEVDEEKLKLLEQQFKENFFKSIRETLGNVRTCEGKAALAILPYQYQGKKKLFIDPVKITAMTEDVFNHLVSITTQSIKRYQHVNGYGTLETQWLLKNDKVVMTTIGYDEITGEKVKQSDWNVSYHADLTLDINFLPIAIFKNNWRGEGELCGYDDYLELLDVFFNTVDKERINSRTRLLLNETLLGDDVDKVVSALRNDNQDVIKFNSYDSKLGAPMVDISVTGKMEETLSALASMEGILHKLLRLPEPSESEGKNNKHNLEIAQKDASARDMIEAKKSLVHAAYEHFIHLLLRMNRAYGIIPFTDEEISNFKLVWKDSQSEEEIQAQAMNGQEQQPKEEVE